MRDLHHGLKLVQTLDPALTQADRAGAPVDHQGFEGVEHVVAIGTSGDALSGSLAIECRLEQSEDGAAWTPVAKESDVLGASVDGDGMFALIDDVGADGRAYRVGYIGNARYSRVRVILTGTHTGGTPIGAHALLGHANVEPVGA